MSLSRRACAFPIVFKCADVRVLEDDVTAFVLRERSIESDEIRHGYSGLVQPPEGIDFCVAVVLCVGQIVLNTIVVINVSSRGWIVRFDGICVWILSANKSVQVRHK
jgi:hypothetical protein